MTALYPSGTDHTVVSLHDEDGGSDGVIDVIAAYMEGMISLTAG